MTATTATEPAVSPGPAQRWTILAVCSTALFLVGLDTTIVNVALPEIGRGLETSTRGLEWVVDAYTIAFASLLITSGAVADRWGRRRIFSIGLVTFGAASVLCAAASSVPVLVGARIAQGVGASMLSPVALAIVVSAMPDPKERARAIGVWAATFGLSMAAGPVVAGLLLAHDDWRSVFWINVPIVAAVLVVVTAVVPESRAARARRLDLPGQVLLAALIGLGVALLIEGPHVGWGSTVVVAGAAVLLVLGVAFVRVEANRDQPLIPPTLFRVPRFTVAVLSAAAVFIALSATLLLSTALLQLGRGWTPLEAGAITLPMGIAATVCAPLSGIAVARAGARLPLLLSGSSLVAAGTLLTVAAGSDHGPRVLIAAYTLMGIGIGLANAPITNIAVSSFPLERAGVAGGTTSTARQVGAAVGIAIAGSLLASAAPNGVADATRPGWMAVIACGLIVLLGAPVAAHARLTSPGPGGVPRTDVKPTSPS